MLEQVKKNLGITGNYQDDTIQGYIDEVIEFMIDGGVSEEVANSVSSAGVITRGVADLWNYGSGGTSLSPYFFQRVTQLVYKSENETPEKIDEFDRRITDYAEQIAHTEVLRARLRELE